MPSPSSKDRPEPHLAAPVAAPAREPGPPRSPSRHGEEGAATPLRFPAAARHAERPGPAFTAGERLAVSSAPGGDGQPGRRPSMLRLSLLVILLFFAGIGAVTVYHAVAGVLPG
jgi:hypothetical protein